MAWSFLSRSRGLSWAISSLGEEAAGTQLSQDQGRLSDCKGWTVHGLYSDMKEDPYLCLGSSRYEGPHLALVLWGNYLGPPGESLASSRATGIAFSIPN